MSDDISFMPGDKVVRVGNGTPPKSGSVAKYRGPCPMPSIVYCVRACWWSDGAGKNLVQLVGMAEPPGKGWPADAFRKVSEVGHPTIAITEEATA